MVMHKQMLAFTEFGRSRNRDQHVKCTWSSSQVKCLEPNRIKDKESNLADLIVDMGPDRTRSAQTRKDMERREYSNLANLIL